MTLSWLILASIVVWLPTVLVRQMLGTLLWKSKVSCINSWANHNCHIVQTAVTLCVGIYYSCQQGLIQRGEPCMGSSLPKPSSPPPPPHLHTFPIPIMWSNQGRIQKLGEGCFFTVLGSRSLKGGGASHFF